MSTPAPIDTAALNLMLSELRLPTIKALWPQFTAQADREGWPAARLLTALTEHEIADRARRRFLRRLGEARLPSGKTLDSFDFAVVPTLSKAHAMALCAGDRWLDEGSNLLLIGPPGTGKTHLSAAIGLALIEHGYRVLFTRTTDLAQRLQAARRELALEAAIRKLDKFHLLMLDDFSYVTKDQAETSVLFELISARYEQRSLLITANQPFGQWDKIFPEPAMTVAAIDRLVHRATIFELNVESYRRRTAIDNKRSRQRAAAAAVETADQTAAATSAPLRKRCAVTMALTNSQRQRRYRERRRALQPQQHYRPPQDRRSRPQRWQDAVRTLLDLQHEYQAWLDNLPDSLGESALAHKLEEICTLDLAELESVEPPRGFGRD